MTPYLQTSPDLNFITSSTTPSQQRPALSLSMKPHRIFTPSSKAKISTNNTPLGAIDLSSNPKKGLRLIITPIQNNYYFSNDSSAWKIAKHQNRKENILALSDPEVKQKPKEKIKFTSLNSSQGPARDFNSIKYRQLLLSNYEKMTSDYLYKENEELKDFIGEMKIEGFFIKKKNLS